MKVWLVIKEVLILCCFVYIIFIFDNKNVEIEQTKQDLQINQATLKLAQGRIATLKGELDTCKDEQWLPRAIVVEE